MLNRAGRRFVDEGEDVGFFTYAKYGGEILRQPGSLAWQIFDRKTTHLLEGRYRTSAPIVSNTLEGLIEQLDIDDRAQALRTLDAYNEAACDPAGFDPTGLDGLATRGLEPPKSNWALRLDEPPFIAYSATGGITFTFGGLAIDEDARVLGTDWRPHAGPLYLRRDGRRAVPLQLSRRHQAGVRGGVRPHRGTVRGAGRERFLKRAETVNAESMA